LTYPIFHEVRFDLDADWQILLREEKSSSPLDVGSFRSLIELFPEVNQADKRAKLEAALRTRNPVGFRFKAGVLEGLRVHLVLFPRDTGLIEAVLRWAPVQAVLSWEEQLLFNGDVMEWLLDHSRDMVVIVSPIFEVMYFNDAAEKFVQTYLQQQLKLQADYWPLVALSDEREFLDKVNRAFAGEVVNWPEREVLLPNQQTRWLSSTFFPVRNRAARLFGVALLYHDIHEEKIVREEVKRQSQKLAHISFYQSHRIRRHVANQLALIEIFEEELLGGEARRLFELFRAETQRLDAVIRDITNDIYS
jgi:PAS domain-containing protein